MAVKSIASVRDDHISWKLKVWKSMGWENYLEISKSGRKQKREGWIFFQAICKSLLKNIA